MSKVVLSLAVAASLASVGSANAADLIKPYVGIKAGAGFAQADDVSFQNPRLKSGIGDDYSDTVALGGASAGAAFTGTPFRAELEYTYRDEAEFSRDDNIGGGAGLPAHQAPKVRSQSAMIFGFYDINTDTRFTPFLSAGAGVSFNKAKAQQTQPATNWDKEFAGDDRTDFAWGVGAGVGVSVLPMLTLDIGYRYVDLGKWSVGNMPATGDEDLTGRLRSHEVYVGARYSF
ncbi:MAG: porin family protein [Rhodospirillaceae bacterium]|nr:porin family protein [Rhodospirillales bacterium]